MSSSSKQAKELREHKKDKSKKKKEKMLKSAEEESEMTMESTTNTSCKSADENSVRDGRSSPFKSFNESHENRDSKKELEGEDNDHDRSQGKRKLSRNDALEIPSPVYQPDDNDDEEVRDLFVRRRRAVFLEMALHHPTMLVDDINVFVDKRMSLYSRVRDESDDESEVDINERLTETINKLINIIDPSSSYARPHSSDSSYGGDSDQYDDAGSEEDTHTGVVVQTNSQQQHQTGERNASASTVLLAEMICLTSILHILLPRAS
jgi:hypothetical protein